MEKKRKENNDRIILFKTKDGSIRIERTNVM